MTFVPLRGPNRWSALPMLEAHIAPDFVVAKPVNAPEVAGKLLAFLNDQKFTTSHPQSVANATAIVKLMPLCESVAQLWLECARWFSAMAGVPTNAYANAIETRLGVAGSSPAIAVMAMEMEEQLLSERCFDMAYELAVESPSPEGYPLAVKFRELFDYADDVRLGPSSRAILRAARRRRIPYMRLNSGSLVQLGEGALQRRIWTAETDATSAIAEAIASDKDLTKRLLRQVGVPVPHGRAVTSAEDAWTAANEIGFPVVVKPCNANHQRGISIELSQRDEILKAYDWAVLDGETTDILVEQFARGHHHRLLVVGNRMVAAARGHSECVIGDGVHTVEQLVNEANLDPRRGEAYTDPLGVIKLDAAALIELTKQKLTVSSVPAVGRSVVVRRTGDLTTDCTEEVHPQTAEQAVLAAKVIGLDIAGLDILATDISKPLETQRGAVVEVNAGPSLSPHVTPLYGKPQKVGDAIIEMLFPNDRASQIPIVGILDGKSSNALAQRIAELLSENRIDYGSVRNSIPSVNGCAVDSGCENDEARVKALLCNPMIRALLVQMSPSFASQTGVDAPRFDHLFISAESVQSLADPESCAGLRAVINAVPANGQIYCECLTTELRDWLELHRHPETLLHESYEVYFRNELVCT